MVHTEVLQHYPHVDVVEERLETGDICKTENTAIRRNYRDVSRVLLHKKSLAMRPVVEACTSVVARFTISWQSNTARCCGVTMKAKCGVMITVIMIPLSQLPCLTIAQAISCRPVTKEAWVESQASPSGICDEQTDTRTGFFLIAFRFSLSLLFHRSSILIQSFLIDAL
jgi:hypothetical protein